MQVLNMDKLYNFLLLFIVLTCSNQALSYPTVKVDTLIDFTKEDSFALKNELIVLNKILSSDRFWEKVKSAEYYCTNRRVFHSKRSPWAEYPRQKKDKHDYSSDEIYQLLWNGDDEIGGENDGVINFKLMATDFKPNRNGTITHGSTNRNTLVIKSSRSTRIQSNVRGKYACHLLHEYMHVLGFKHISNNPSKNKQACGGTDVPLKIQKIGESIVHEI
jgi:hypothetical protein